MLKKMSDEQKNEVLKEKKQKEAERKALYRMKKKLESKQCNNKETSPPPKDAYKSRSSKGKVIERVKRNLPCSFHYLSLFSMSVHFLLNLISHHFILQ